MRASLTPQVVDYIPERLEEGVLYISEGYRTVVHLCCCGCGSEVVTPLGPADWSLQRNGDFVTLTPSVGNWSMPCRSHYWIRRNQVVPARAMSEREIHRVRARDRGDKAAYISSTNRRKIEQVRMTPTANAPGSNRVPLLRFLWDALMGWLK